jgi:hypothetical protein
MMEYLSPPYFFVFVCTSQFVLVNVVVAVLMKQLEDSKNLALIPVALRESMMSMASQKRKSVGGSQVIPNHSSRDLDSVWKPGSTEKNLFVNNRPRSLSLKSAPNKKSHRQSLNEQDMLQLKGGVNSTGTRRRSVSMDDHHLRKDGRPIIIVSDSNVESNYIDENGFHIRDYGLGDSVKNLCERCYLEQQPLLEQRGALVFDRQMRPMHRDLKSGHQREHAPLLRAQTSTTDSNFSSPEHSFDTGKMCTKAAPPLEKVETVAEIYRSIGEQSQSLDKAGQADADIGDTLTQKGLTTSPTMQSIESAGSRCFSMYDNAPYMELEDRQSGSPTNNIRSPSMTSHSSVSSGCGYSGDDDDSSTKRNRRKAEKRKNNFPMSKRATGEILSPSRHLRLNRGRVSPHSDENLEKKLDGACLQNASSNESDMQRGDIGQELRQFDNFLSNFSDSSEYLPENKDTVDGVESRSSKRLSCSTSAIETDKNSTTVPDMNKSQSHESIPSRPASQISNCKSSLPSDDAKEHVTKPSEYIMSIFDLDQNRTRSTLMDSGCLQRTSSVSGGSSREQLDSHDPRGSVLS